MTAYITATPAIVTTRVTAGDAWAAEDHKRREGGGLTRKEVGAREGWGEEAAPQERPRMAVIAESTARHHRTAIKVAQFPDLGPRRINPQGHDRQRQIDDPDP